ncbi:MAG: ABC transporter permease [Caldilineae bacterium]|nr:MAG: ABC transporter permease [Caldilineae bacterium]
MSDSRSDILALAEERKALSVEAPASGLRRRWQVLLWSTLGPIAAILAAFVVSGLMLLVAGFDPLFAFATLLRGAFGDLRVISEVLLQATPLMLIGVGLAVAFRSNIWNIGAEGQFYAGAVLSTIAGIYLGMLPAVVLVPLVLVLGFVGGALWGVLAGWFKVRFGASEIVTTIMLNYVAIIGTGYLVTGPMIEQAGTYPQTAKVAEAARLYRFLPPTRLHIGFLLALVFAVIVYVLLFKTSTGYAIRAAGHNQTAARYAGIDVERTVLLAMGISGGAAGLAGAIQVSGLTFRLYQQISPGYGFTGIAVALLAGNHPLGVILSALLFGALRSGSEVMQISAKIPSVLVFVVQGLVILSVVSYGVYQMKLFGRLRVAKEG